MNWTLPTSIIIDEKEFFIRNKCDYRVVLDVIEALNDDEIDKQHRISCALCIFYEDLSGCTNLQSAAIEMMKIINLGEIQEEDSPQKPPIMDWSHDFPQLAPPISRVLGYSVRDEKNYTHWFDFFGAYQEIGECLFSTIVSIRSKRQKGKKLEQWEQQFYAEHKKMVDLPCKISDEEKEWLEDW